MAFNNSNLFKNLLALLLGLAFGLGLIIANMTNPAKVLAFLDVAGDWDPSLAFVMASALLTLAIAQRFIKNSPENLLIQSQSSCDGTQSGIDKNLLLGAATFGTGWGLSGICPGPAFVGLSSGEISSYSFFAAMLLGFMAFNWVNRRR